MQLTGTTAGIQSPQLLCTAAAAAAAVLPSLMLCALPAGTESCLHLPFADALPLPACRGL